VHTVRLEDTEDLVACILSHVSFNFSTARLIMLYLQVSKRTSNDLDLSDTMAISQDDTDLGGSGTLASELADIVNDGVGRALEPGGHAAGVGDGRRGDTLALAVKATHIGGVMGFFEMSEERVVALGKSVPPMSVPAVVKKCESRNLGAVPRR
jgi:hypothetical protein